MKKIDLKKQLKDLYGTTARQGFVLVDVPEFNFLMIDGEGNPSSEEYTQSIEALYAVAYPIKFLVKKGPLAIDYGVMPTEGLWWANNMDDFVTQTRDTWKWTMCIMQPEWVTADMVEEARETAPKKKGLPKIADVRFDAYHEGQAAQCLYTGPYTEEHETIAALHAFIADQGLRAEGKHHEIYLNDARKTAPEKLKTVLRQPVVSV